MRYVSFEQITQSIPEQTLIQLTNDIGYGDSINMGVLDNCVDTAEQRVDAYLSSRYTLPLVTVHSLLTEIVVRLTRYYLYSRRPEGALPDAVKEAYKDAMRELEAIRDGKIMLGISIDTSSATNVQPQASMADFQSSPSRGWESF